jgi:thiamine-phosphate diphosphorylase
MSPEREWPLSRRPVVCLVTPGRVPAGASDLAAADAVLERVAAAVDAEVDLVQIREPGLSARALTDLVKRAVTLAAGSPTSVIVNERLDVALAAGAHGVHLREAGIPAARVRAVTPRGFLIGRSVHAASGIVGDEVDYWLFGTVFPTASKPADHPTSGLAGLRAATATGRVVLAIGGIRLAVLPEIAAAGAAGFAGIGLFEGGTGGNVEALRATRLAVATARACRWR